MSENPSQSGGQPSDQRSDETTPESGASGSTAVPESGSSGSQSYESQGYQPPSTAGSAPSASDPSSSGYSAPSSQPYEQSYGQSPGQSGQPYGQQTPAQPYEQTGYPPQQSGYDQGSAAGYAAPGYGQQQGYDPNYGQQQQPYGQDPSYGAAGYPQQGGYDPNQPYGPNQSYGAQAAYPQPQYAGQPAAGAISQSDERLWATLSNISTPFIGFIGPLVIYLIFKDKSAWLKESLTEALNFSILYTIAQIIAAILTVVIIGAILLPLIAIGGLVFCILAAIASNKGEQYKYPLNWRMIK